LESTHREAPHARELAAVDRSSGSSRVELVLTSTNTMSAVRNDEVGSDALRWLRESSRSRAADSAQGSCSPGGDDLTRFAVVARR